ncbi:MAG TPA: prolyl oligopeptidase family serine peptidase [Bacteroidia bacterium]|nr:prolyl oligopeptidase family serine peptidase [Bacteroidia bacterium]
MKKKLLILFSHICICFFSYAQSIKYPVTKKIDQKDTYFNTVVEDPYRWLEDDHSTETAEWVEEQNKVTEEYFSKILFREKVKNHLTHLWNFPKYTAPFKAGQHYFFFKNDGIQNQNVMNIQKDLDSPPAVFLDPNLLSADGTISLNITGISHDGNYFAYGLSKAGSDWSEVHARNIRTGKEYDEVLKWVKFSGIAWYKNGFFYSRYDAPKKEDELKKKNEFHKIFYHTLGTPQENDSLICEDKEHPLRNFGAMTTDDQRLLFIGFSEGSGGNGLMVRDLSKPYSEFIKIVPGFENKYHPIDHFGDSLLIRTNYNAPKGKVILVDLSKPGKENWKDFIPEKEEVLEGITQAGDKFIARYMKDASHYLQVYDKKGMAENKIQLDAIGTIDEVSGDKKDSLVFYSLTSFTFPSTVYKYNLQAKKSEIYFRPKLDFNSEDFETKQVWYDSKDGTKIPMFIVIRKGTKLDGNNPVLLFGYGGFNLSKTPEFKTERLVFLENGGIFAMPNLRGGGEYGEDWHKAGIKLKKQNVFDDFIAAAEYLIKEKYTNQSKLAIGGRSNGGLLVGAAMTQHPELFKVAVPTVGVMDMLRYHKFTIGWAWKSDYGTSENEEEFKALYAYSPLHNIKTDKNYPATLVTTGDHDDRVVPAHSFKFISALQEKYKGTNPVLIRIDTMAGHGGGKPTGKLIEEQADIFTFMMYNLGMEIK